MHKNKPEAKPSLKWELIAMIITCWILPVLVMVSVLGYYINENINEQFEKTTVASAKSAAEIAAVRLDAAVAASRRLNYAGVVKSAYYKYEQTGDRGALYNAIKTYLTQQYKYDDKFVATMLFFCDEPANIYHTYNEKYLGDFTAVRQYTEKAHSAVTKLSPSLGTDVGFLNVDGIVYMVRNVLDANDSFKPYAVLVMELNTSVIFEGMKNVMWGTGATLWLNDTEVVVVGGKINANILENAPPNKPYSFIKERDRIVLYGTQKLDACDFSYVVEIDRLSLLEELSSFKMLFVALLILIVPLLLILVLFFYRNIQCPINTLVNATKKIKEGELGYKITQSYNNREFEFLTQSFNSMSQRLKEQFERIYSEELALRDARIMALQSQINPHFLNNTLEIINWEARLADNIKVSRMIEALSTMLDAALDRKGKPVVRLAEEMMYVDAYLYIINERLGKRLTITKDIDKALLDCLVPRLVLQPIIENAVEHGVQAQQQGNITIRVYKEGNVLVLQIQNDGDLTLEDEKHIEMLLSPNYDAKNENSNSLGICNVNQRIKMLYGVQSGLTIKSDTKGHVVAKIIIAIEF